MKYRVNSGRASVAFWCALAALAVVATGVAVLAAETLHIVPTTRDNRVVVSIELSDAYTDEVREAIASGLRTTFTYDVALKMVVPVWVDPTIASSVISISDQYDNLTRRHSLSRTVDGRVEEALVTEDATVVRRWLTKVDNLQLCSTSKLDPTREYYVTINASARPRGGALGSLFSAVTGITGQAKFTFIP
ncbi:MAG: DUF4390 domain-containing protein [Betaproteobacteria bacterium]